MNLRKNSYVPNLLFRIFTSLTLLIIIFLSVLEFTDGGLSLGFFFEMIKVFCFLMGIFISLILIGYYGIFSWIHGNGYVIHFKITDKKIIHEIDEKEMQKNKMLIFLGKLFSIFSKSPGGYGAQMLAEGRRQMTSNFKDVIKIKIYKNKILIKDRFLRTNVIFTTAESHQEIIDLIRNACKSSVKIVKK